MRIKSVPIFLAGLAILSVGAKCRAGVSKVAQENLSKVLLGKGIKPLLNLPATKEGIDVYVGKERREHLDERGIDMKELTKYLKSKGVGVQAGESDIVTEVKVDSNRVEIHIGGGGEGRRGSSHANKVGAAYLRAGGSRVNFLYGRNLTDGDIEPKKFVGLMARVLDVSAIQESEAETQMPAEFKAAIRSNTVIEGMTYEMVLLSMGNPDQKKINDSTTGLSETWYYLKEGHRWVVDFSDGKVSKVRVF